LTIKKPSGSVVSSLSVTGDHKASRRYLSDAFPMLECYTPE